MDRRFEMSSDGESSGKAKRHAAGSSSNLERLRRMHGFSMETIPTHSRSQELYEVQQIVANLAEVEFIDNLLFDQEMLLPISLNNKVDQAQVVQTDHGSSAGLAEDSEHVGSSRAPKGLEDIVLRYASNQLDSFVLGEGQHCQVELPTFDACLSSFTSLEELDHFFLTETPLYSPQAENQHEVQQMVLHLEKECMSNSLPDAEGTLPISLNNKVDQAQVAQTDYCSSEKAEETSEPANALESFKRKRSMDSLKSSELPTNPSKKRTKDFAAGQGLQSSESSTDQQSIDENDAMEKFLDKKVLQNIITSHCMKLSRSKMDNTGIKIETRNGLAKLHQHLVILRNYSMYNNTTKQEAIAAYNAIKEAYEDRTYNDIVKRRCQSLGLPFAQT